MTDFILNHCFLSTKLTYVSWYSKYSDYIGLDDEQQYRCKNNRRVAQSDPHQKKPKSMMERKSKMGNIVDISVAALAILAISIFTGIFLFLFIMFATLGTLKHIM